MICLIGKHMRRGASIVRQSFANSALVVEEEEDSRPTPCGNPSSD
jgi:hypothetical protein